MYYIVSSLLSLLRIPKLRTCLSIPHRARFLEPLHAHVQVGMTPPRLVVVWLTHFQFPRDRFSESQARKE